MIHNIKDILKYKNNIILNNIDIINNFIYLQDFNNKYIINYDFINLLLDTYEDGIYGILNYTLNFNNNNITIINSKLNDYKIKNKITKNIEKLLNNGELSNEAIEQNYGILELYKKENNNLINMKEIYILQNGSISYLNDYDDNIIHDIDIITKIYHFDNNKIKHINTINRDNINDYDIKNIKLLLDIFDKFNENNLFNDEINKLINLTQYNDETKNYIINMNYENNLILKISDPINSYINYYNIFNLIFDFETINPMIDKNKEQYDKLWFIFYGKHLDDIIFLFLDKYSFNEKIKLHIKNIIEILLRYNLFINKKINFFSIDKRLYDLYTFKDKNYPNFNIFKQLNKQLYKAKFILYLEDPNTISTYILSLLKYISLNDLCDKIQLDDIIPYSKDLIKL